MMNCVKKRIIYNGIIATETWDLTLNHQVLFAF